MKLHYSNHLKQLEIVLDVLFHQSLKEDALMLKRRYLWWVTLLDDIDQALSQQILADGNVPTPQSRDVRVKRFY